MTTNDHAKEEILIDLSDPLWRRYIWPKATITTSGLSPEDDAELRHVLHRMDVVTRFFLLIGWLIFLLGIVLPVLGVVVLT